MTTTPQKTTCGTKESAMSKEVINENYNINLGIEKYSNEEQQLLRWFWNYGITDMYGSTTALCKSINKDWTVILKVFQGNYDAKLDNICDAIQHLRKTYDGGTTFISTEVTEKIMEALDYARDFAEMVTITGSAGRSKSHTAEHWTSRNRGRGKYIRIFSKSNVRTIAIDICKACGISTNGKTTSELKTSLLKALDYKTLLILDEAGHMLPSGRNSKGGNIEFIRDLYDACGCGVALIFTGVYLEDMKFGTNAAYLQQYIGRSSFNVRIPDQVLVSEIKSIVGRFRENPPNNILTLAHKIANTDQCDLRTLFQALQRAKTWSMEKNTALTYQYLLLAEKWRLSGGIWSESAQN